jgi:predicted HD superfamily hydrolase involved in NAD metabolism
MDWIAIFPGRRCFYQGTGWDSGQKEPSRQKPAGVLEWGTIRIILDVLILKVIINAVYQSCKPLERMGQYSGVRLERLRQQVLNWLAEQVPESRVEHILRVEQMAIALAKHHGEDATKAGLGGLMHDLAKYFKPQQLLEMAIAHGLPIDPVDEANPHLLHANVGAIVAREEFAISDISVLQAIANHTLGSPNMDPLSCIVYLADSLEPGRGQTPGLEHLRRLAYEDLPTAVWQTADYSIQSLLEKHRLIHPRTLLTRNGFMQQVRQRRPPLPPRSPDSRFGEQSMQRLA